MMPGMMPWGMMGGAFPAPADVSSHPGAAAPGAVVDAPPALEDAGGSRSRSIPKAKTKTKAKSRSRSRRRRKVKHKQQSSSDSSS